MSSIVSLIYTKDFLQFICISPFERRLGVLYYLFVLVAYEAMFASSSYVIRNFIFEFTSVSGLAMMLVWFFLGRAFTIGIFLSLWNQFEHRQLIERITAFDVRMQFHLGAVPSFRRLNYEFIALVVAATIYHFKYLFNTDVYRLDNLGPLVFYFCCILADYFFTIYAMYMVYWARVFVNRSDHVIEALRVLTMCNYICKNSLTVVMELLKLIFDVHTSIQNTFGTMLLIVIMLQSFVIAIAVFVTIQHLIACDFCTDQVLRYMIIWVLPISLKFVSIVVFFNRIGDVVSEEKSALDAIGSYKELIVSFMCLRSSTSTGDENTKNCDAHVYRRGQANIWMRESFFGFIYHLK